MKLAHVVVAMALSFVFLTGVVVASDDAKSICLQATMLEEERSGSNAQKLPEICQVTELPVTYWQCVLDTMRSEPPKTLGHAVNACG